MPKPEWGTKRTCPNCETRFYDLQREPILCPECGATFNMDDHGKVSGMRERRAPVAVAEEEAEALVDDEDALVDDEEDDEAVEDPLLADEEEDEEPAGPTLADEDDEDQPAAPFKDDPLLEEDEDEIDEDEDDEEEDLEDLDETPGKNKGG